MARFRSNKRSKELQRKAKHEAKEARKKERQEKSGTEDDIDWSQAVGFSPAPEWNPPGAEGEAEEADEGGDASAAAAEEEGSKA